MALELKVGITNNKDNIIVSDITGDYNAVSNPTGWGSPNPAHTTPSPVSALTLDIYKPGSSVSIGTGYLLATTFFTSTDRAYNVYADPSSVVPSFTLQDGIWKYEFNYTINSVLYTVTKYSLRDIDLKCALGKLALGNMDSNDYDTIKTMYDKMVQAFECEEYTLAQDLYTDIQEALTDYSPYIIGCGC
jgi:hypothetical protein